MLYACNGNAERVLPSLPKLVRPLRNALSKFNVPILLNVLQVLPHNASPDSQFPGPEATGPMCGWGWGCNDSILQTIPPANECLS